MSIKFKGKSIDDMSVDELKIAISGLYTLYKKEKASTETLNKENRKLKNLTKTLEKSMQSLYKNKSNTFNDTFGNFIKKGY